MTYNVLSGTLNPTLLIQPDSQIVSQSLNIYFHNVIPIRVRQCVQQTVHSQFHADSTFVANIPVLFLTADGCSWYSCSCEYNDYHFVSVSASVLLLSFSSVLRVLYDIRADVRLLYGFFSSCCYCEAYFFSEGRPI